MSVTPMAPWTAGAAGRPSRGQIASFVPRGLGRGTKSPARPYRDPTARPLRDRLEGELRGGVRRMAVMFGGSPD